MRIALNNFKEELPLVGFAPHKFKLCWALVLKRLDLAHLRYTKTLLKYLVCYQLILKCIHNLCQSLILLTLLEYC